MQMLRAHALRVPRAEVLRDDDARAGRECNESIDEQVGDTGRRAADRGERGLAERAADDDGVGGVVELLSSEPSMIGSAKSSIPFQMRPP